MTYFFNKICICTLKCDFWRKKISIKYTYDKRSSKFLFLIHISIELDFFLENICHQKITEIFWDIPILWRTCKYLDIHRLEGKNLTSFCNLKMVYGFMYLVCFIDNHELKLAPDHKKIFHSYSYRHTM